MILILPVPPTGFWVTGSLRKKCEEEEKGGQAEEEERDAEKQKRVGGRETIKQEEEGSPRLHQVSYRSYSRPGTQMIIVGTFIFLQDLFWKVR